VSKNNVHTLKYFVEKGDYLGRGRRSVGRGKGTQVNGGVNMIKIHYIHV
jgi:hypothetical protein